MKHKYQPNQGWFACNIKDEVDYSRKLQAHFQKPLTPERLKLAIDEDSYGEISLEECGVILSKL